MTAIIQVLYKQNSNHYFPLSSSIQWKIIINVIVVQLIDELSYKFNPKQFVDKSIESMKFWNKPNYLNNFIEQYIELVRPEKNVKYFK